MAGVASVAVVIGPTAAGKTAVAMALQSAGVALYQASYDLLESNATLLKMTGKIIQNN